MKNKLFGQLGEKLKGNGLTVVLGVCVVLAGLFSYNTIKNINKQLENQKLQKIEATPSPTPEQETQDVQENQENVPLPTKPDKPAETKPESQPEKPVEAPKEKFILPVEGKIFAVYSGDELVYNRTLDDWRTHNGIDIRAMKDDPVRAGADGTVEKIYTDGMLGTVVEVNHGDFVAKYCGLAEKTFVKEGDKVTQGQNIGTVDKIDMEVSEEPHLHLEIVKDGKTINPNEVLK